MAHRNKRRPRRAAPYGDPHDQKAPLETTRGSVWAERIGWLASLMGAFLLLTAVVQHVAATHGTGLGYDPDPSEVGYHGGAMVVSIFGPLVGFNLVYFGSPATTRRRNLALFMALMAVQALALTFAALWVVGAGLPSGLVTSTADDSGGAVAVPLSFIAVTFVAAAIMYWLGGSSDFDRQSSDYFDTGSATVAVRPLRMQSRIAWVGALVLLAACISLPLLLSGYRQGVGDGASSRPWPLPYDDAGTLRDLTLGLLLVVSVPLGVAVSMLLKAWLYATVWRGLADRSRQRPPSFAMWLVTTGQHVPMVLAAICWLLGLGLGVPRIASHHESSVLPALGAGLVAAAVELLVLSQMWRVQDQKGKARPMRLTMAAPPMKGLGPR